MTKKSETVSYSQLKNWIKCPNYHKLISISKEVEYPENKYIVLGRAVHESLERILSEDFAPSDFLIDVTFDECLNEKIEEADDIDEEAVREMAEGYYEPLKEIPELLEKYEIEELEKEFSFALGDVEQINYEGYKFTGYIDCVASSGDEVWLMDFKTSTKGWHPYYHKEDEKKYYQLVLYRYFYHKKFDIPLENIHTAYIIFNARDEEIEFWELGEKNDEWPEALKGLNKMIYNAYEKGFYPYNKACKWCECRKHGFRDEHPHER